MEPEQVVQHYITKNWTDSKVKVSIEQTAKGEPRVSVEISGDDETTVKERAVQTYKDVIEKILGKEVPWPSDADKKRMKKAECPEA